MSANLKKKCFRLKPDTMDKVEEFMTIAQGGVEGITDQSILDQSVAKNTTKAIIYLILSYFDDRVIKSHGTFDGSLAALGDLISALINTGNDLNALNRSLFTNTRQDKQIMEILNDLAELVTENNRLLSLFNSSYQLNP